MRTVFDLAKKKEKFRQLETEIQKPDFWKAPEGKPSAVYGASREKAIEVSKELARLKEEIEKFEELEFELEGLREEFNEKKAEEFERKLKQKELKVFFSGKYDRGDAILSITSGAGGQDAQDWATLLLRMYQRYCASKGYKTKILHQSFGEGGGPEGRIGTKEVSLEIKGDFAYGILKKENGVHRLVRISPFSPKSLRHTSFALVEVIPEISKEEEKELKIKPEELKQDTFRASGPGGQYVNRRESAVRITHLPTGIVVSCQSERLQGLNRKKALEILAARIYQLKEMERQQELKKIKGPSVSVSWGNQIRSYVLHPYKLVKDLRTDVETSNTEAVLNGDLDEFVEAEIKLTNIH